MNHWLFAGLKKSDRAEALYKYQIRNSGEIDRLLKSVSTAFDVHEEDIKGRSRLREISDARHCFVFLSRLHTSITYQGLGKFLKRNHATVIHSAKAFEQIQAVDKRCFYKRIEAEKMFTSQIKCNERPLQKVED